MDVHVLITEVFNLVTPLSASCEEPMVAGANISPPSSTKSAFHFLFLLPPPYSVSASNITSLPNLS
jgi:hypothetical protein